MRRDDAVLAAGANPRTSGMGTARSDGLYLVVAVLRGGRRLPIQIEGSGPLAAQDHAEIVLGGRHLPVIEVLGSIEELAPRWMADRSSLHRQRGRCVVDMRVRSDIPWN